MHAHLHWNVCHLHNSHAAPLSHGCSPFPLPWLFYFPSLISTLYLQDISHIDQASLCQFPDHIQMLVPRSQAIWMRSLCPSVDSLYDSPPCRGWGMFYPTVCHLSVNPPSSHSAAIGINFWEQGTEISPQIRQMPGPHLSHWGVLV